MNAGALSLRDLEQRAQVLAHGPAAVLYAVCDHVVDEYERQPIGRPYLTIAIEAAMGVARADRRLRHGYDRHLHRQQQGRV